MSNLDLSVSPGSDLDLSVSSVSHLDVRPVPLGRSLKCQVGQRRLLTSSKVHLKDIS